MAQTIHHPEVIKAWRKNLGLTQEELATKVGIGRQHVNRLEAGKHVSLTVLGKIAKQCNQPLRAALTEAGAQELEKLTSLLD